MDRGAQKVVSAIIGIILSGLLVYIGYQIVSQRASQASQPENFTCERVDVDTCRCSGLTKSDEPLLLRYGETSPTFYYRMESVNIEPQADGTYKQEADINNLGSGQVSFLVENHEDIQTSCPAYTASAGSDDTSSDDSDIAGIEPISSPQPTTRQPEDPVAQPTITPDDSDEVTPTDTPDPLKREPLTRPVADAFFADSGNADADAQDCFEEFKDDYYGVVQVCNEAWRAK